MTPASPPAVGEALLPREYRCRHCGERRPNDNSKWACVVQYRNGDIDGLCEPAPDTALATPPTPAVAEGAKPIAREPTEAMMAAYRNQPFAGRNENDDDYIKRHWRAMWDAAPSPEGVGLTRDALAVLQHIRRCVRYEQSMRQSVVIIHEGSATMADIDRVLDAAVGQEGPSKPEGGG